MADNDLAQALVDVIKLLHAVQLMLAKHQEHIFALEIYLSEQRDYDPDRFAAILREFRTDPEKLAKMAATARAELEATHARLMTALQDFEGPPQ